MSLSDVIALARWTDSLGLAACYALWRWTRREVRTLRAELDRHTNDQESPDV